LLCFFMIMAGFFMILGHRIKKI